MASTRILVALVALLGVALCTAQDANQCGNWLAACTPLNGPGFIQYRVDFGGISDGLYNLQKTIYNDDQCSDANKNLTMTSIGTWTDMGPGAQDGTRKIYMLPSSWVVTPWTDSDVATLMTACACDGQWAIGISRTLTSCPVGTCDDTAWIGGSAPPSGITFGQPMYGLSKAVTTNPASIILGKWDSVATTGYNNQIDASDVNVPGTPCDPPVPQGDFCSSWVQTCNEIANAGAAHSFNATFSYVGPADDPVNAGTYTRKRTTFTDEACKLPYMSIEEFGNFIYIKSADPVVPGGYTVGRNAPATTITTFSDAATQWMQTNCACGVTWVTGQPFRLTSCNGACDTSFNQGLQIGAEAYANARRLMDDSVPVNNELRFSDWSNDQDTGANAPLNPNDIAYVNTSICDTNYVYDYCGLYILDCASMEVNDEITYLLLKGEGERDGTIKHSRVIYEPGQGCGAAAEALQIMADGQYSIYAQSTTTEGASQILIKLANLQVTPMNDDFVLTLNSPGGSGCPCGGKWVKGTERIITSCPAGTCPGAAAIFGSGTPDQPGFGLIRRVDGDMRLTQLSADATVGFNTPFGLNDFIFNAKDQCPPPRPSSVLCGAWNQPCIAESASNLDYTGQLSIFGYDATGGYELTRNDFQPGSGCTPDKPYLTIEQKGAMTIMSVNTTVKYGTPVMLHPEYISVTPLTDDAVTKLTTACPCGKPWVKGTKNTFTTPCAEFTCDTTWLRQPLVGPAYGVMRVMDSTLRMTSFAQSEAGWTYPLTADDVGFIQVSTDPCTAPSPIFPPSGSSSSDGISGGGIFLIIFFVLAFVYFAGGMALNYKQSGSPALPHAEFWRGLPSLIAEGFEFTFCGLCGLRSTGGPKYRDLGDTSRGGYGTL